MRNFYATNEAQSVLHIFNSETCRKKYIENFNEQLLEHDNRALKPILSTRAGCFVQVIILHDNLKPADLPRYFKEAFDSAKFKLIASKKGIKVYI